MSSVTEATDTSLTGALVEAGLQSDVTFTGAELLFSEFAFILICHFGTETRTGVLWMFLSLNKRQAVSFDYFQRRFCKISRRLFQMIQDFTQNIKKKPWCKPNTSYLIVVKVS